MWNELKPAWLPSVSGYIFLSIHGCSLVTGLTLLAGDWLRASTYTQWPALIHSITHTHASNSSNFKGEAGIFLRKCSAKISDYSRQLCENKTSQLALEVLKSPSSDLMLAVKSYSVNHSSETGQHLWSLNGKCRGVNFYFVIQSLRHKIKIQFKDDTQAPLSSVKSKYRLQKSCVNAHFLPLEACWSHNTGKVLKCLRPGIFWRAPHWRKRTEELEKQRRREDMATRRQAWDSLWLLMWTTTSRGRW